MGGIRTNEMSTDIVILHQTHFVKLLCCPCIPEGRVLKAYMRRYWF